MVYRMADSAVTDRVPFDELAKRDIFFVEAGVSQDGSMIYLRNTSPADSLPYQFTHQYDVKSNVIKSFSGPQPEVYLPSWIDGGQYDPYLDFSYLIGYSVIDKGDSFMYLRAASDWSMKSLQLVICQYADGASQVYDIF